MDTRNSTKYKTPKKTPKQKLLNNEWTVKTYLSMVRASDVCERWILKTSQDMGIKVLAQAIINAIYENGGTIEQRGLAAYLRRTRQAINVALINLENKDLIFKDTHMIDKRKRLITLTEKGWRFAEKLRPFHNRFFNIFSSCLSEEESKRVMVIFNRLSEAISADLKLMNK